MLSFKYHHIAQTTQQIPNPGVLGFTDISRLNSHMLLLLRVKQSIAESPEAKADQHATKAARGIRLESIV